MYLRYGANQQCGLVRNATCSKMFAREMLDQTNTIWLQEMTNAADSSFEIISN